MEHDSSVVNSIQKGVDAWSKRLTMIHGTSNNKVFKIYDHLAKELCEEVVQQLLQGVDKDLDKYCENVIYDEF